MYQIRVVNSSFIYLLAYNTESQRLRVIMRSGNGYEYQQVPANVFMEMAYAPSVGQYFNIFKNSHTSDYLSADITREFMQACLQQALALHVIS